MPHLEKSRGSVVNVSSVDAVRVHPSADYYGSFKAALDHLTRNFAQKHGKQGVRLNCVNPGSIRTMIHEKKHGDGAMEKIEEWCKDNTTLGRIGEVSEMSSVIRFLASEDASYVTGATWLADGGLYLDYKA